MDWLLLLMSVMRGMVGEISGVVELVGFAGRLVSSNIFCS